MARPTSAARRYAEAAFELAQRDDALDKWRDDLALAAEILMRDEVMRVADNPALAISQRREVIAELLGDRVAARVRNLVALLAERNKLELLPAVLREYRRLLNRLRGIVTAIVSSAAPLTPDEEAALRGRIEQMTGAEVELELVVDPALIGGLTVRIGDRLVDASVRGRLERLRNELVAGAR